MSQESNHITLDPNSYANVIKVLIKNFLRMKTPKKSSEQSGSLVIDIQLLLKRDFYIVKITHCNRWTHKGIEKLFNDFYLLAKNWPQQNDDIVLGHLIGRSNGEENETVYEIRGKTYFERKKINRINKFIHFPSFRNYLLIKLKYKLPKNHLLEFKKILLHKFNKLKKSHQDVKIMFYFEKNIFYNNNVKSDIDFQDCKLLSLPLINVIKQSMNNEFKERCLETLGVNNVYDGQKIITKTLFSLTNDNYIP